MPSMPASREESTPQEPQKEFESPSTILLKYVTSLNFDKALELVKAQVRTKQVTNNDPHNVKLIALLYPNVTSLAPSLYSL